MKAEILKLLKDSDGYLSGQQLCDRFQVSRTAVWKVMEQLKKEGYEIEAVRNKGYRLIGSCVALSGAEIESSIKSEWAGRRVVYFEETDSTNLRAKEAGEKGEAHGSLYVADCQISGKGRRGRSWESPSGTSIYMTLLLRPKILPGKAPQMTLLMALAVADGIRKVTGLSTQIKWPNDIILNGKKICGILTEMSAEIDYINYVVVGVGINCNQETFPEELQEKATSLKLESGQEIQRAAVIAAVMESFEKYYQIFEKTEDLSGFLDEYNELLVNREREVLVLEPGQEYEAYALGINSSGELIVKTADGQKREIFAGEVSVRGVYGYV